MHGELHGAASEELLYGDGVVDGRGTGSGRREGQRVVIFIVRLLVAAAGFRVLLSGLLRALSGRARVLQRRVRFLWDE